jgi:cytochrome P450
MSTTYARVPASRAAAYVFPEGPRPKPLIGSTLEFSRDPLGFVTNLQHHYGKAAYAQFMGHIAAAFFFTPAAVKYFLVDNARNFTNREFASHLIEFLGNGLLTIDGDLHRQQRRLTQPAFHRKRIESYATTMTTLTEEMLATWRLGEIRDIASELRQLTLRIVAKTLFDIDITRSVDSLGPAFNKVVAFPDPRRISWENLLRINLPITPYGRYRLALRELDAAVYRIIAERRASRVDVGDIVSMLLSAQDEDGSVMTDTQIRDQLMTFFAAGHETTANTLAWTFYLLSGHPEVWQQLRYELNQVLGRRTPTVDDLPSLPITGMVLKESIRLYPPAWALGRRAIDDFEVEGYHLPAGTYVVFPQWVLHRLPEIWGPDALDFRPERFDPAHPQEIPPFAYYPFGGGSRMCIGMPFAQLESHLLLATIAQRFRPTVVPRYHVVPLALTTLRPKYGIQVILES